MRLFVSALEYSANIHLKYLLCELIKRENIELCGIFDKNIIDEIMRESKISSSLAERHSKTTHPLRMGLGGGLKAQKNSGAKFVNNDSTHPLAPSAREGEQNALYGKSICNINEVAVMGFIDVLKRVRFFLRLRTKCLALALECDKILLMDSSSFNIPLAKRIKARDCQKEIMYYILPQVWAWKPWRAKAIEAHCDKLCAILPFEVRCYKKKARFVGHPLLDEIKHFKNSDSLCGNSPLDKHSAEFIHPLHHPSARKGESKLDSCDLDSSPFLKAHNDGFGINSPNLITFMPGSRLSEINRIFPIFLQVKDALKAQDSAIKFILVVPRKFYGKNLTKIYGDLSDFEISFDAHTSLFQSKFAFICSGTATLECALIGTPFVLGYLGRWIEAFVVKRFLNIRFVGLANILYSHINMGEKFHNECLQENLTAQNLLDSYKKANPNEFLAKSFALRKYLKNGSAEIVADLLLQE